MQVHMPNIQMRTNGNIRAWSRGSFAAGSGKELWVSQALKSPELPKEFQQTILKSQVEIIKRQISEVRI